MEPVATIKQRYRRARALIDKSAWLLITPALAALFFLDQSLARTLVTWSAFGVAIAGVSVIISRIIFPHIDLSRLYDEVAEKRNTAAGILAGAIVIFVGLVMLALVAWAKA